MWAFVPYFLFGAFLAVKPSKAGLMSDIRPPVSVQSVPKASSKEVDVLARTIWGEARSEGEKGMRAVACVVLNRVKWAKQSGKKYWWGNSISEVCLANRQFSCWLKNDPNLPLMKAVTGENANFKKALVIAESAAKGTLADITNGADHYHTVAILPAWAAGRKTVAVIGYHKFYKLEIKSA